MAAGSSRTVVVTGATGLQGGAVARCLLEKGWRVCALTRQPRSGKARALAALGAEVAQGDMDDPASLGPVFASAYGVFSVQNPMLSGSAGEIRQGKNVADAARQAGVQHVVYASAGTGARGTGIPSWESKLVIEDYMHSLGLPLTVLRPTAFMELMTEKKFFPAVGVWNLMPRLMGSDRPVPWLSAEDTGAVAAAVFADPSQYIGQDLRLASDVQTIDACRDIYRAAAGKAPPYFPMPLGLFRRFGFAGQDLPVMWGWLRSGAVDLDTQPTRAIHPQALTVREWLARQAARRPG